MLRPLFHEPRTRDGSVRREDGEPAGRTSDRTESTKGDATEHSEDEGPRQRDEIETVTCHRILPTLRIRMSETTPTTDMITRIAAQLMVLYDEAINADNPDAAEAYARALNVVRTETNGVRITFDGPSPILRKVPRVPFPEEYVDRLSPAHRPSEGTEGSQ